MVVMGANIIDGKAVAQSIRAELAHRIEQLKERGVVPGLGVVLVGDNAASISYVTSKEKACAELGIFSDDNRLPAGTPEKEVLDLVARMNSDARIHGILVQLPLPSQIDEDRVINAISAEKDADGFHPVSLGRLMLGQPGPLPATPHGIVQMLMSARINIPGSHVVIVGRSNIVGKPLANMLMQRGSKANATVTVCHTGTRDLAAHTRQADILVAAAGRPGMITADMVKPGAVVIDVGTNRVEDSTRKRGYRVVGDVEFEAVKEIASSISPVPGGVGPMTITMLLHNTVTAAERLTGAR